MTKTLEKFYEFLENAPQKNLDGAFKKYEQFNAEFQIAGDSLTDLEPKRRQDKTRQEK